MKTRKLGSVNVSAIGVGCMSLTHGYGTPPSADEGARLLNHAIDIGYTHFDNAAADRNFKGHLQSIRMSVPGGRSWRKQAKPAQLAGQNSLPGPQSAGQPADPGIACGAPAPSAQRRLRHGVPCRTD